MFYATSLYEWLTVACHTPLSARARAAVCLPMGSMGSAISKTNSSLSCNDDSCFATHACILYNPQTHPDMRMAKHAPSQGRPYPDFTVALRPGPKMMALCEEGVHEKATTSSLSLDEKGRWVCQVASRSLSTIDATNTYGLPFTAEAHVRVASHQVQLPPISDERRGMHVLASLYAGENFGHMLADNFYGFWQLKSLRSSLEGERTHLNERKVVDQKNATLLLANSCDDTPWAPFPPPGGKTKEQYAATKKYTFF